MDKLQQHQCEYVVSPPIAQLGNIKQRHSTCRRHLQHRLHRPTPAALSPATFECLLSALNPAHASPSPPHDQPAQCRPRAFTIETIEPKVRDWPCASTAGTYRTYRTQSARLAPCLDRRNISKKQTITETIETIETIANTDQNCPYCPLLAPPATSRTQGEHNVACIRSPVTLKRNADRYSLCEIAPKCTVVCVKSSEAIRYCRRACSHV